MPRSMATPTPPATRNAAGTATSSDQSKSPGAQARITAWVRNVV